MDIRYILQFLPFVMFHYVICIAPVILCNAPINPPISVASVLH